LSSHRTPTSPSADAAARNDINARIDYFGFGVDLKTERPTRERIAKGASRVLGDKRFAQNVEKIRAEFGTYHPLDLIDGYVAAGDGAGSRELPGDYGHDDHRATSEIGSAGASAATKRSPAN
jgi:hypothetical protein